MEQGIISNRKTCRVCGHFPLLPILSLGNLYVSDFIDEAKQKPETFPLELILCNADEGGCGLLQLKHTVSHESMYRNYWYRSGMNKTMSDELHGIARKVEKLAKLTSGDTVMDIGANDGTLLQGYTIEGLNRNGFEPARNLGKWNSKGTSRVLNDFFNYEAWQKEFGETKAKVITAIAMFYDLEDPNAFVGDVTRCLDEEGVFVIQMSYLPSMLSRNAFDNICHEHLEYYSLLSLENLLKRHNLEVFDVELNDVNGGSFRTYIRHVGKGNSLSITPGSTNRVSQVREEEIKRGLNNVQVYKDFVSRVRGIGKELKSFIAKETALGKKVYVYGASTKGNTLLQFFGLDSAFITAAAERNEDKWGRMTVGTNIPIVSEDDARTQMPDYFLVLPWHFLSEFKNREAVFFERGGKFIVPLPTFRVIGLGE